MGSLFSHIGQIVFYQRPRAMNRIQVIESHTHAWLFLYMPNIETAFLLIYAIRRRWVAHTRSKAPKIKQFKHVQLR